MLIKKVLGTTLAIASLIGITGCISQGTTAVIAPSMGSDNVIGATATEILVAESMRFPILKMDPSLTNIQKQCVDEIDLSQVAKPVQAFLMKEFTAGELAQLDDFFASDSAQAASQAMRMQIASLLAGGDVTQGISLTTEQTAAITRFSEGSLGKKFEQVTKSDGDISQTVDDFVTQALATCLIL